MDIKLPNLGEGADSGVVVSILVKEGDTIQLDQTLIELENEKAIAPIPSTASGKVTKLYVKEGDKLSVGQPILSLASNDKQPAEVPATPMEPSAPAAISTAVPVATPSPSSGNVSTIIESSAPGGLPPAAAPTIRKIARELGIDLNRVRGSERGGRIVMEDLRAYVHELQEIAFRKPAPSAVVSPTPGTVIKPVPESIDFSKWGTITSKPVTSLRKAIAHKMVESWTTIPHVTQYDEADITQLMELRKKNSSAYEKKGTHLTITPFAMKAVVDTLKLHPIFNSSWDEAKQEIVYKDYYHIGVAVDTEQGLLVPVIRDVDKKSLLELSIELDAIADKARQRKVTLEELKGGSFTISNQGGIGSGAFTPIINHPEVAILGMGRGAYKPVARDKKVEVRLMLPLSLSYDHRVIDGANAARFMVDLVKAMESFDDKAVQLKSK